MHRHLRKLLDDVCNSIDSVASDLEPDRPLIARVLRKEAETLRARSGFLEPTARDPTTVRTRQLSSLLYEALDAGLVDSRDFDRIKLTAGRRR